MRAIRATRFGTPDVLELVELADPEPAAGEIRIAASVANVHWLDTAIRSGDGPAVFPIEPPYVPGGGAAGTVDAIGDGIDPGWLGERVVARPAGGAYGGGYADTLIATPETAYPVPPELDLHSAMAVMDDGSTALALLEGTPVGPGDRVLVAPGVGGLGNLLVQLAVRAGATVIAAVRGPEKQDIARKLGAEAVDYSTTAWLDDVRALGGVDVVFDGIGGALGEAAAGLLVDGGRFSGYGMSSGSDATITDATIADARLRVVGMSQLAGFWPDSPRRVRHVLAETAAGRLAPIIGRTYPLAAAAEAHADIEARRFIGKSLLLT
jgi:NADPH:quinone reductase